MAFSNPVNTPSSGEALVDGLLWDKQWSDGTAGNTRLAVYIAGLNGQENFDFGGETATADTVDAEATAFRLALQLIENVCNIDFSEVASKGSADIILAATANGPAAGSLGIAVPPGEDPGANVDDQGAVLVNYLEYATDDNSSIAQGGYDFITFIHELGHAIGLKHPHDRGGGTYPKFPGVTSDSDTGDFGLNQGIFTMMSYNDGFPLGPEGQQSPFDTPDYGWSGTPMALDIAALQYLYGANTSFATGNDTYVLGATNASGTFYSCIWDAGGSDKIVAGGDTGCVIDLRAATLNAEEGGGGFVSSHNGILGGFTIANGVVIEKADGSISDDKITGNDAANTLRGRSGKDTIDGGKGNDAIDAGGNADIVIGGEGADTLTGSTGADKYRYSTARDSLNNGQDIITDFEQGKDLIDLRRIDARDGEGTSDDTFRFINSSAFVLGVAGDIRFQINTTEGFTKIYGNTDNDTAAEFTIQLDGIFTLTGADFLL